MTDRSNDPPGASAAAVDLQQIRQAIRELQGRARDEWEPDRQRRILQRLYHLVRERVRMEKEGAS